MNTIIRYLLFYQLCNETDKSHQTNAYFHFEKHLESFKQKKKKRILHQIPSFPVKHRASVQFIHNFVLENKTSRCGVITDQGLFSIGIDFPQHHGCWWIVVLLRRLGSWRCWRVIFICFLSSFHCGCDKSLAGLHRPPRDAGFPHTALSWRERHFRRSLGFSKGWR